MKKLLTFATAIICGALCLQSCNTKKDVVLTDNLDTISYALGVDYGTNLATALEQVPNGCDKEIFLEALTKSFTGEECLIDSEEAYNLLMAFFQSQQQANQQTPVSEEELAEIASQNELYLQENKQKDGVMTTASGLQYRIITKGTGAIPTKDDVVRVHYTGTLIDGTKFDSSYDRNEPAEFPVQGVIEGWVEALQMMPVGSKWELTIPPQLGYGDRDMGQIKPNSILVFEVELLDIVK
ncbi:MAG: FKBP-type peptidyl-prolyl cis-trans isomerase [Bacteroidales bacterium]|nr:FKBP-type peptidyl-prolyl cis-trans isomerase [Bacteroidales bacterium]